MKKKSWKDEKIKFGINGRLADKKVRIGGKK